ncbi:MAG: GNAT family N-acetyltransferase [Chlamydiia bacterium]|nr:GNAT family N-acetyltransferase [Chlamydiia bacterium]
MKFVQSDPPTREEELILYTGLYEQSKAKKGLKPLESFGIFIKDDDDKLLGGITGVRLYGCCHIDTLWLKPDLRGQGLGRKLVDKALSQAKDHGCTFSTVHTMDFEARPFYESLGFHVEYERTGYEKDSVMYLLRKELTE